MTYIKKGIVSKVLFIAIVFVLVCSLLIPCFKNYSAFAETRTSSAQHFIGRSNGMSLDEIHKMTRLNSASEDSPSITLIVHGQGGDAAHWSNDNDYNFAYDTNSMIENLRRLAGNANVYWAKMDGEVEQKEGKKDVKYKFYLSELDEGSYNTNLTTSHCLTEIEDISKHTIVVFESYYPDSYHRVVYEELHTVIDKISYDFLYLTGKIPTVNIISHSRGGLVSMLYASGYTEEGKLANVQYEDSYSDGYIDVGDGLYEIPAEYDQNSKIIYDHPYNVAELYSMGSPYHGTDWDEGILGSISHSILSNAFSKASAKNILDETIQSEIHNCWEVAVSQNNNLQLNAIAGTFNLSFILGLLSEDYEAIGKFLSASQLNTYLNILDRWGEIASVILTAIDAGLAVGTSKLITVPYVGWVLAIPVGALTISVAVVDAAVITAVSSLNEFQARFRSQLMAGALTGNISDQTVFTELTYVLKDFIDAFRMFGLFIGQFTGESNIVHDWGDLFIDTKSQSADGFSNVTTFEKFFAYADIGYTVNEANECVINYSIRSFDYKRNCDQPAIPHNLETRDSTIIHYVCENIELGFPSTIYDYEILPDNTVKITDTNLPGYYFDENGDVVDGLKALTLGLEAGVAGKPVSYIDSYAFADFSNLKTINLPNTITEIDDGAFINCVGLSDAFVLPENLKYLGEAVFYNCPKISEFNINSSNSKYYTIDGILYATASYCANDGLEYKIIRESYGRTLVALPGAKAIESYSLPLDVVNIARYAVCGNKNLSSVQLNNVINIGDGAFEGCSNLKTIYGGNSVKYVGGNAFKDTVWFLAESTVNKVIGKVLIKYNDNDVVFEAHDYVSISANAFNGNNYIQNIVIGKNTKYIGKNAFGNCKNLSSVTILSLTDITQVDEDIFKNCANGLIIYVPNSKMSQYSNYVNLRDYVKNIQPIVIELNFDTQGGEPIDSITAYYGDFVNLPVPVKAGYDYKEWKYNNTVLSNDIWEIYDSPVTLKAQWTSASYVLAFDRQNGTGGTSSTTVYYKQPMPIGLTAPTREGYTFGGYFSEREGEGTPYYSSSMGSLVSSYELTSATTLYAYWIGNPYRIEFDMQGGLNGTPYATATYGSAMPQAQAPEKTGSKFMGYFSGENGTGDQYYSYSMDSARNYNIVGTTKLYAYWVVEKFEIVISSQEQWVEINSKQLGLTNMQVSTQFGTEASKSINSALIEAYKSHNGPRTGYELLGFYLAGDASKALIDWGNSIPDLGEDGDKITLEPKWEAKKYTFTLNYQSGKIGSFGQGTSVSVSSYKSTDYAYIYFVPSSSGTITLWTSHTSGDPYLYLYNANKVQLAYNDDGYGNLDSKITYSVVGGQGYYVGFRTLGSTPCNGFVYYSGVTLSANVAPSSCTVEYDGKMPTLVKPYRNGYTFGGYYTQPNGAGEQIYPASGSTTNKWGIAKDTTLYAYWMANSYTITLNKQSGSGGDSSVSTYFSSPMTSAAKPTRTGYTFEGYYTSPNGMGTKYYNSSMGSVRSYNIASNLTLYANWTPITYSVYLDKSGGSNKRSTFSSTIVSYNKEDITYIYFVPSASGTITLWTTHTEGDPYLLLYDANLVVLAENDDGNTNLDSKITYYVTKGKSYYVGFRALYGAKTTGTIQYSGISVYSSSLYIKATYDQAPPSVVIPTKDGYAFDGYYTATNGQGTKVYDCAGTKINNWNLTNTTLYANWIATTYSYTGSTTTTIYGTTSIIDLSSATTGGTYVFTVATTVNEITFKSTYSRSFSNFRIIINSRSTPLVLRFSNVSITAPANYNAITAYGNYKLTLAYSGTVSITGGRNSTIGTGKGYDAIRNSTAGATIALKGTGTLKLIGGLGSTGAIGSTGSKGADGSDGSIIISHGGAGSNGGVGGQGGTGGTGGYAIYASKVTIESISGSITLTGGKGGTGGRGGTGGEGGRGGHGAGSLLIAMNGGNGGNGGAGGRGGTGGYGGSAVSSSWSRQYSSCVTPTVSAGAQGNGGRGGTGGNGGYGGSNGPSSLASGTHGTGGSGGTGGAGGTGSVNGSSGYSGSSGGYWYATW